MRNTKIGPAFSDFISAGKRPRRRGGKGVLSPQIVSLIPLICLVLVSGFFFVRLFFLQVVQGEYYARLSDENRTRTTIISAPRGIMYDRKNRPLVSNAPAFKILDSEKKVRFLNQEDALEKIARGEDVVSDIQREYLYKDAFAHVLGYIGQISEDEMMQAEFKDYALTDFVGKFGLESQYENILHGKNGRELYEVDAAGNKVRFLGKDQPIPGRNLYTTLDIEIQMAVHEAMKDVEKGAVIVSDPKTGGILALYSKPTFDPNLFTHNSTYEAEGAYKKVEDVVMDGKNQPLLDRAISGIYPPASTYKLVSATAALESGAMKRDTLVKDTGILRVGDFSFGNWFYLQYGGTDGDVDVVKAIARSNDIYFYKAAEETGIDRLADWSRKFGLGQRLGIDLAGEKAGTVPDKEWKKKNLNESWYLGDNYNMGIGQGYLQVTPLQVNMFTVPFANGGVLYKPHLLKKNDTSVLRKDFLAKETINAVREGMKQSCEPETGVAFPLYDLKVKNDNLPIDGRDFLEAASGSARMTQIKVGCKTGTAEVGIEGEKPHAWITVIAPFHNPELVVTVLSERSGEGSQIAAPIAKKILEKYFEGKK